MKWCQKYHVTNAVHNIPSFASISQWACRRTSQPGRNQPNACSIGATTVRHRSAMAGPQDSCTGFLYWHRVICVHGSDGSIKNWWYDHNKTDHNKQWRYFMCSLMTFDQTMLCNWIPQCSLVQQQHPYELEAWETNQANILRCIYKFFQDHFHSII